MKKSPSLPLWQSVFWIVGSTLFISGTSHKLLQSYFGKKEIKEKKANVLSFIVQTGLQKEALHSDYLAELLGLSKDKPTLFEEFDEEKAVQKLLASPLLQEARVKKIAPNIVYIDYVVRKPIAWASDFVNTALDKEGYLFPMNPFFSPKKIPEIYLGKDTLQELYPESPSFSIPLQGKLLNLSFSVLDLFKGREKDFFRVKSVDVSKAFFSSLGKRGITVVLEHELAEGKLSTHFLRLTTESYPKEISNYLSLRPQLVQLDADKIAAGGALKERVIDLRLSQLAFVD